MTTDQVPAFQAYMNPTLAALRSLGGKASIETLDDRVKKDMGLAPDVLTIPHKSDRPDRSEVSYRIAWARTYLKFAGLLTNPSRGIWALSDAGLATAHVDEYAIASEHAARARVARDEADDEQQEDTSATYLPPDSLLADIRAGYETMLARGEVIGAEQALAYYRRFRERFGPEVLKSLDGERLLTFIHGRQTRDSLVYWLEFKDDEDFPARFGSISGGSALKFGIYQARDDGTWWEGTPQKRKPLSLDQAVDVVRGQRDELIRGQDVLTAFAASGSGDYDVLQKNMMDAAPKLAETAWGHKYFALLNPAILDDYHVSSYQKYHLIKMHMQPSDGRYANAGPFVRVARELAILPTQLSTVLNQRDGSPHDYWRVGTTAGEGSGSEWPRMRDGGFVAIGWTELGDLSAVEPTQDGKDGLRARMAELFPAAPNVMTRKTQEVFHFVVSLKENDVVVAMDGGTVRGVGIVRGPYYFQTGDGPFGHRHRVEWRDTSEWVLPEPEGLRTTFVGLKKHNLLIAVEQLLQSRGGTQVQPIEQPAARKVPELAGILARVQSALERKLQVILYGPPGTGKTYWAFRAIKELVARSWFGKEDGELTDDERREVANQKVITSCTFHPAYGYEDFIEGYRPVASGGGLAFHLETGLFKEVCDRARRDARHPYFILIDEINRGDIPRIFGELLTLLEKDKRGRSVRLPLSRQEFAVPENVRLVGTMNTADRSIALLDAALRRRFAFVEVMPDPGVLGTTTIAGLPLGPWLGELNDRIVKQLGRDARNLQVGHAYLMQGSRPITDSARFLEVFRDDILPLLVEYCYDRFDAFGNILGSAFVVRERQTNSHRAEFADGHQLIEALLQSFEGLATAPDAIAAESTAVTEPDEVSDDDAPIEDRGA